MLKICVYSPFPHTSNPNTITTTKAKTDLPKVLSMDMTGQLDVFRHYGYMLGMYGAQVGILKDADQIIFSGFL